VEGRFADEGREGRKSSSSAVVLCDRKERRCQILRKENSFESRRKTEGSLLGYQQRGIEGHLDKREEGETDSTPGRLVVLCSSDFMRSGGESSTTNIRGEQFLVNMAVKKLLLLCFH